MRPGKTPVSCVPCAKRKVRCDKQQPCGNCKRRPQDECRYSSTIPSSAEIDAESLGERVIQLERYIRRLGGDPKVVQRAFSESSDGVLEDHAAKKRRIESVRQRVIPGAVGTQDASSGLVLQDEEATYIESPMWYSWGGINQSGENIPSASVKGHRQPPSATRTSYLPSILDPAKISTHHAINIPEIPTAHLNSLWKVFLRNVHPLVKIFFDWEVEPVMQKASQADPPLPDGERVLVFAIIFMSLTSLSEDECASLLHQSKSELLSRFQQATEASLLIVNYSTTTSIVTLQAFMLYLLGMSDRAHPSAVYSLMGVASRIAERMGLHRDGELLGLSVLRTEERRRIWWQLQYMELMLARHVGSLCITLFADWDAKMPANLEDEDLNHNSKTLPPERTKLTSMSQCLWSYHILYTHREIRRASHGIKTLSWILSPRVPLAEKDVLIDGIESKLRQRFLQYCDLLEPLHVNLQLGISQYILSARRIIRQPALVNARISEMSRRERDEFLGICTKGLEYCNMSQTNEMLKGYLWHNRTYFPWVAFVYVILESHHRSSEDAVKDLWNLIQKTYAAHSELRTTVHREDITFAARITLTSWKRHSAFIQEKNPSATQETPQWILELCRNFDVAQPGHPPSSADQQVPAETSQLLNTDFDFDIVDWAAWDETYMNPDLYPTTA